MRKSHSVKDPSLLPEHRESIDGVVEQIEPEQDGEPFRVVKLRSRTSRLGDPRTGRRRMGRWDPPPRPLEI
jgi:hypothetical protein